MKKVLKMFEGYGVELEYMIVEKESLKVNPIADELIKKVAGEYISDLEFGEIGWSNELVLHVIELKTNGPAGKLNGLNKKFYENIKRINSILEDFNSMLLPTGAHPFMDPFVESKLWNHEYNQVYEAYNRIFDCRGHGWSNLQSTHINLPFSDDEEFGKLHAAIRVLLPIIPALSASTPIIERKATGFTDSRLEVYRTNQMKIPSIAGKVIPEQAFSKKEYEEFIFKKIYKDIEPYDVDDILKFEWLNSRGAIARFDRNTFEIRIIDIQECPTADLAITFLIAETLKKLIKGVWCSTGEQQSWNENNLSSIFLKVIKHGEKQIINEEEYLKLFGLKNRATAGEIWENLAKEIEFPDNDLREAVNIILKEGTLSTRILKSINNDFSDGSIVKTYRKLSKCLADNRLFVPDI